MSKITTSPEAAYLTSPNIVHPQSNRGTAGDAFVADAEARGRTDIIDRTGLTVTGGTIKKGR